MSASAIVTPVTGFKPGTRPRISRGYVMGGVTHATTEEAKGLTDVTTLCGRTITVAASWQPETWALMVSEALGRLRHYQHGTCIRCAKISQEA